jgi:hypothetical protein
MGEGTTGPGPRVSFVQRNVEQAKSLLCTFEEQ